MMTQGAVFPHTSRPFPLTRCSCNSPPQLRPPYAQHQGRAMTTMTLMSRFVYSNEDFIPLQIDNDGDRFCFQCERTFWPGETIEIIPPGTLGNYAWIGRRCRYSCKEGRKAAAARSAQRRWDAHVCARFGGRWLVMRMVSVCARALPAHGLNTHHIILIIHFSPREKSKFHTIYTMFVIYLMYQPRCTAV